mmetsp:Transcript_5791/g.8935  ORF Transcript_5791/g.8935 Transcript_5791/m.8935 type:complete len:298 (+) Transcript_5791:120-1013(+)
MDFPPDDDQAECQTQGTHDTLDTQQVEEEADVDTPPPPCGSPLPPCGKRTWAQASCAPASVPQNHGEDSSEDQGIAKMTDKDLEEDRGGDVDEIFASNDVEKVKSVLKKVLEENNRLKMENGLFRRKTETFLSPAIYTVHAPKTVKKMRLGRTASISTKDELTRLTNKNIGSPSPKTMEELGFCDRVNSLVRPGGIMREARYLASQSFAEQLLDLCDRASAILQKEARVLEISSPCYVFGDFHGNFEDLQFFAEHIWPMGMRLSAGSFLFLGDYVDRGVHGLELVAYLLTQKNTITG